METINNFETLFEEAKKLIAQGKETDSIRTTLSSTGADQQTIETIIQQVKSLNYLKRRKRGFFLGLAGSILLIVGFVLTVIFYHANISFGFVMYSMTSIGAILLIAGLVEIIGW